MKRALLAAACVLLLAGCSPRADQTAAPAGPSQAADITEKVCTWDREPVLLRFLDEDTLGVECRLETDSSTILFSIGDGTVAEEEQPLDAVRPNSFDREVLLENGGTAAVSEDQDRVFYRTPAGTRRLLLDGSALEDPETYWMIAARGKWGAVSGISASGVPCAYLLDLDSMEAVRLEMRDGMIPADIEGDLVLFAQENVLNPAGGQTLQLYDAASGSLLEVDAGSESGASHAVLSAGGRYLLSCAEDTQEGTLSFSVFDSRDGSLVTAAEVEGYGLLADSAYLNMALNPDGNLLAALAYRTPEDTRAALLLYRLR